MYDDFLKITHSISLRCRCPTEPMMLTHIPAVTFRSHAHMLFPGRPGHSPAVILLVPAYALAIDRNVAARPCFLGHQIP